MGSFKLVAASFYYKTVVFIHLVPGAGFIAFSDLIDWTFICARCFIHPQSGNRNTTDVEEISADPLQCISAFQSVSVNTPVLNSPSKSTDIPPPETSTPPNTPQHLAVEDSFGTNNAPNSYLRKLANGLRTPADTTTPIPPILSLSRPSSPLIRSTFFCEQHTLWFLKSFQFYLFPFNGLFKSYLNQYFSVVYRLSRWTK